MTPETGFWTEFSRQAPGIVGVIVIAFMFLKWGVRPFLEYLREQTASWQAFLKEQRELSNAALGRMSEEMRALTNVVIEVKTLMVQHDSWERESATNNQKLLQDLKNQQKRTPQRRSAKTGQDA